MYWEKENIKEIDSIYMTDLVEKGLPNYWVCVGESSTLEKGKFYIVESHVMHKSRWKFKLKGIEDRIYYPGKFRQLVYREYIQLTRDKKLSELLG